MSYFIPTRRALSLVVASLLFSVGPWGCAAEANERADTQAKRMNAIEIIQHWTNQIKQIPSEEFAAITDFSAWPSGARTESLRWCKLLFSAQADPHAAPNQARHSFYAVGKLNLDVLRHQYTAGGRSLTVYEGVNFVIARVPPLEGKPWNRNAVEDFAQWALNPSATAPPLAFHYPETIGEGTLISTAPAVDPTMMQSWVNRVDLLVQQGHLHVIGYKRYPGKLGFLHDGQWFEDELRRLGRP